jgi:hypothetical protein
VASNVASSGVPCGVSEPPREAAVEAAHETTLVILGEGGSIMRRHVVAFVIATGLLALPAGPSAAGGPSCVGQFASTNAQQDGAAFGADISFGAQFASQPNFGAGVVAPFAHLPRDTC